MCNNNFADNKDKCDWHSEHAWTCKTSWSKVRNFSLGIRFIISASAISWSWFCFSWCGIIFSSYFIDRILLTSTSEVYGDPLEHPQTENYWGNVNPIGMCFYLIPTCILGFMLFS
jgi:hypothetical protein